MVTQSLMSRDKVEAKKKGLFALSAWTGAGVLFVSHWPLLGLAVVGGAVYLTYRWFMFRAKRGMRF
jgi:nitrate reductase NapE component